MSKTTEENSTSAPPPVEPQGGMVDTETKPTDGNDAPISERQAQKDAYYRCFACGRPITGGDQMVEIGTLSGNHTRFHAACAYGSPTQTPSWRAQELMGGQNQTRGVDAPVFMGPIPGEQLTSQIGSTMQGPWSSVTLTKNTKGYTHELKLYFPPEMTPADLQERGEKYLKVIEKLESIGAEGRYEFDE